MTCRICDESPCICQKERGATAPAPRSTYTPRPLGITKEDFGLNLYATIQTIGGLFALEQQMARASQQGEGWRVQAIARSQTEARQHLANQLPALAEHDLTEIIMRYPTVAKL